MAQIPKRITLGWLLTPGARQLLHDQMQFNEQSKRSLIVSPSGKIAPGLYSHTSEGVVHDLRDVITSAEPEINPPPVLTATADDPNSEIDVTWTLPGSYDELILERSPDDESAFEVITSMAGNETSYEDEDVTPGTEYFYRIRGRLGGAYTAYSNVDSAELEGGDCEYALPDDMADADPFFQGFANGDFSDALWTTPFSENYGSSPNPGYGNKAGNCYLSEDGKNFIAEGELLLTRNGDDSFTVTSISGGVTFPSMSRGGILAGRSSAQGAVWESGVGSAPTLDAGISAWYQISADGERLYGVTTGGNAIERTDSGDTVIEATIANNIQAVDFCGNTCIISDDDDVKVFKKVAETWTHVATLAGLGGDVGDYPAVTCINNDGTRCFGGPGGGTDVAGWTWDLSGTGTISATAMAMPAAGNSRAWVTSCASDGSVVAGYHTADDDSDYGIYWLQSEGFSTAHSLQAYFGAQGLGANFATIGSTSSGKYTTLDTVVVSATGQHFVARAQHEDSPTNDSLYYVAVATP